MAFRRTKGLCDFLVRARLKPNPSEDNQNDECRPCGRKKMSILQNGNPCWYCGHGKTEAQHRLHTTQSLDIFKTSVLQIYLLPECQFCALGFIHEYYAAVLVKIEHIYWILMALNRQ